MIRQFASQTQNSLSSHDFFCCILCRKVRHNTRETSLKCSGRRHYYRGGQTTSSLFQQILCSQGELSCFVEFLDNSNSSRKIRTNGWHMFIHSGSEWIARCTLPRRFWTRCQISEERKNNRWIASREEHTVSKTFTMDTITADHRNFYFLISTLYCQMQPNTWINLIKGSHKTR